MKIQWNKIRQAAREHSSIIIIITAAILLELITYFQYCYTHDLLEKEESMRAESELAMKAILVKGMLRTTEKILNIQTIEMASMLDNPDALMNNVSSLIERNPHVLGGGMAFKPDHFPQKGRFFEPYAKHVNGKIEVKQVAGDHHDYTRRDFYTRTMERDSAFWTNPYRDDEWNDSLITSYAIPIHDNKGESIGVYFLDISLEWLGDTINYRHMYPSTYCLMLTEEGQLIAGPSQNFTSEKNVEKIVEMINNKSVPRLKSYSGHSDFIRFYDEQKDCEGTIYTAFMRGKPHWKMVVVCYDDEVFADLAKMRRFMFFLMLTALGILAYIVLRFNFFQKRLNKANIEQERISGELNIASGIQMSMLPHSSDDDDEVWNRPDLKIHGTLLPAKEVGGDIYDYLVRNDKLFFCIGDVSGKGVPSALVMATTHTLFRSASVHYNDPAHIMQALNKVSCHNNSANMFVTLFVGVLDLPSGRLRYCNAGHDVPFLLSPSHNKEVMELPVVANLPIGLFSDMVYEQQEMVLEKDTTLFLYTDGLTEARNQSREMYGIDRAKATLLQHIDQMPEALVQTLADDVHRFTEDAEPSDDLTMLAIRYTQPEEKEILDETLHLRNELSEVPRLNEFVKSVTTRLKMENGLAKQIQLALEEAVVNIIDYAYPIGTDGHIDVCARSNGHRLKITISDSGVAFDPTEAGKVDTSLSAEDRPIGGLGIFLVSQIMDSVNYERVDGCNILTLRKKYE